MDKPFKDISVQLYREILNRGQELEIKVGGSSMWPFVRDGETLVLKKVPLSTILRGDIIATYVEEQLICHRVFRKNQEFIQTKADSLIGLDKKIRYTEVLGKVIAQKRNNHIHKCQGWHSVFIGTCILWFSFLWAPMIPVLRRWKSLLIH